MTRSSGLRDDQPTSDERSGRVAGAGAEGDIVASRDAVGAAPGRTTSRRSVLRRVALVLLTVAVVFVLVLVGGAWWLVHRYTANVAGVPDVFAGLDEAARPPVAVGDAFTVLLVGSDVGAAGGTTGQAATEAVASRSDVLMLLRVAGDRQSASVVSIPRDSWVDVPGRGLNKINAAYAFGGPPLLIRTVEQLTGIRVDNFAVVDFAGFKGMTDALGGVDVQVSEAISFGDHRFERGLNHLDGDQALAYVRQHTELPRGDLDRVQRQQNYIRAMFAEVHDNGILRRPSQLDEFLLAFTSSVGVDDTLGDLDLVALAASLRELRPSNIVFFTAPVAGLGMEGDQSVVYLDDRAGDQMWQHMSDGTLNRNSARFEILPAAPR